MNVIRLTGLALMLSSSSLISATESLYCPQNHAYISVGMTQDEVISACGKPASQQESNQPVTQKVPVMQLIYNNKGSATAFYGVWNLTTGVNGGSRLELDIVNKKVRAMRLNSNETNATTLCSGNGIQIGDPVEKVYYSCGSPSITNNTYINEVIPTAQKPQVWIYQPGQYQPSVTLTFVDGKLKSIN
jgi:hypothetical protein